MASTMLSARLSPVHGSATSRKPAQKPALLAAGLPSCRSACLLPGVGALGALHSAPVRARRTAAPVHATQAYRPDEPLGTGPPPEPGYAGPGGLSSTEPGFAPALAVATFAAVWYSKYSVDTVILLQALAVLQLFVAAVTLITKRYDATDNVATVIGPSILAAAVLGIGRLTYLDAATALFGYYLSERLEGPFWLWIGTLVAALYFNYGTLWYTIAFALLAVQRLVRSGQNGEQKPWLLAPIAVVSGFAIYKEATVTWALCLYLAQIVSSGIDFVRNLTK